MKPTIFLALHSASLYGAARSMIQHVDIVHELGYDAVAILPEHGPLEDALRELEVETHVVPIEHFGLRSHWRQPHAMAKLARALISRIAYIWRVAKLMRSRHKPVLHAHSLFAMHTVFAATLSSIPVIWHIREELPTGIRFAYRNVLLSLFANDTVFVSQGIRTTYRALQRSRVIYNYIEHMPTEAHVSPHADTLRITYAGTLRPMKGAEECVTILEHLHAKGVCFSAHIAGSGDKAYVEKLRSAADAAGISDCIQWLGYVENMHTLYDETDVLLVPSRSDSLPRVVMEAMAREIPAVASHVGGLPEMIDQGATGYVCSLEELDSFVEALAALAADPTQRQRMGKAAAAKAKDMFSRRRYVNDFDKLYAQYA